MTKISFHFRPCEEKNGTTYAVEKADDNGKKRRYLQGITSGPRLDGHDERMTEKAIADFMGQANAKDILLFPDVHGIKDSEDIGILEKAEITETGDWFTAYRLYDQWDDVGTGKLEKINTIWKQANGLSPYRKARKKGFSIEGVIPDDGIVDAQMSDDGVMHHRVIDKVDLDGVVLVPKPAYQDSVAHSVYKALGEMPPWKAKKIKRDLASMFKEIVDEGKIQDQYFRKRYQVQDALDKSIERVMVRKDTDKRDQLELIFREYTEMMIELIMESQALFASDEPEQAEDNPYAGVAKSKIDVYKGLLCELQKLSRIHRRK